MSGYVPRHTRPGPKSDRRSLPDIRHPDGEANQDAAPQAEPGHSGRVSRKEAAGLRPEASAISAAPDTTGPEPALSQGIKQHEAPGGRAASTATIPAVPPPRSSESKPLGGRGGTATIPAALPQDDSLLDTIRDAGLAVREHPELAGPLAAMATGEVPDAAEDPALKKIRRRRWPIIIAVVLSLIVIGGAITYYVLASQVLEREASRTRGYALLDEAISFIQESDQVVVALDSATNTEVTAENLVEREVLLERVPKTLETLDLAEERARGGIELLASEDDREFAQHVIDAAAHRKVMLTSGEALIAWDIVAMNSALTFGHAWELIVNADTELRATTELSKTGNYGELREAIERNNAIIESLQQASDLLDQAQEAFVEADYSAIAEYLVLKRESVQLAIEADQAILDGDVEAANTKNAEFGLKDAAVVEAAGRIPPEPLTIITDAYDTVTSEDRARYDSARANAAEADGYIREYTGVETQTGVQ